MSADTRALLFAIKATHGGETPPYDPQDQWTALAMNGAGGLRVSFVDPGTGSSPNVIDLGDPAESPTDQFGLVVASANFIFDSGSNSWIPEETGGESDVNIVSPVQVLTADNVAPGANDAVVTAAFQYAYDGATFDRVRVPVTTKIVSASATGNTTVWTPASGFAFRLMRGTISVAAVAAVLTPVRIRLTNGNGGTVLAEFRVAVDTTLKGDTQIPFDFGNGQLGTVDVPLVVNLDTALTAGAVAVNVSGTEEQ